MHIETRLFGLMENFENDSGCLLIIFKRFLLILDLIPPLLDLTSPCFSILAISLFAFGMKSISLDVERAILRNSPTSDE